MKRGIFDFDSIIEGCIELDKTTSLTGKTIIFTNSLTQIAKAKVENLWVKVLS